jgi:PAS domain S-box-containing protein
MRMCDTRIRDQFLNQIAENQQWLQLLELVPNVFFFIKDRQRRFMVINRKGCEYCGVSAPDDAIGRTDHDFFPKQRADAYAADDEACMETSQPIVNRIESAPEHEGSPHMVVTSKLPLHDKRGRVIGIAGCCRQIDQLQLPVGSVEPFVRVAEFLHAEYARPIRMKQLADMAALSLSQFERSFRRAVGMTPHQYLLRIRIEEACRLLALTEQTVSAIANATGFHDHAHLSRSFSRLMNSTPSQYRKTHGLFPRT